MLLLEVGQAVLLEVEYGQRGERVELGRQRLQEILRRVELPQRVEQGHVRRQLAQSVLRQIETCLRVVVVMVVVVVVSRSPDGPSERQAS